MWQYTVFKNIPMLLLLKFVLDYKESWVAKNWCFWTVVLDKSHESPLDCKEIKPVHPKGNQSWIFIQDWCWSWNSNTLTTWCEELTHLKRPWCWEKLKAEEGNNRGWHGWMAPLTQWTWVWVNSGRPWSTGKPGCCSSWVHKFWAWPSDWTATTITQLLI